VLLPDSAWVLPPVLLRTARDRRSEERAMPDDLLRRLLGVGARLAVELELVGVGERPSSSPIICGDEG